MSVTIDDGPQDLPDRIVPNESSPKRSFGEHIHHIVRAFTTKQGLIGTYDYGNKFSQKL
jgi:NCS2 family nucleobase:cation symporter-2